MFIDCAKLEKILKTDYKTWGVKFGLTEKGMYILNGTGWIIEADNTKITKEFLGTVIKTCGLAPEKGEFMTYQQGHDPQFETERKPLLWDMAEDTKEALISPIKIMQNDNMMTVVKTPGGARLINDARLAMSTQISAAMTKIHQAPLQCTETGSCHAMTRWQSGYASRVPPISRSLRS